MKVIDVYKQYFKAECVYNDIPRKAVSVTLISTSDNGEIKYEVGLSFFPHREPEDFAISYDAYASKEIYHARGRRSKKREAQLLADIRQHADSLATELGGTIAWDHPLIEARMG